MPGLDLQGALNAAAGTSGLGPLGAANALVSRTDVVGNAPNPGQHGLVGWNFDPAAGISTNLLTSGVVYFMKLNAGASQTVNSVGIYVATGGATLTAGQNLVGLYGVNAAGTAATLLSGSADQSAGWTSSGAKVVALTTPQAVTAGSTYYVAVMSNGTTPITLIRGAGTAIVNFNLATANSRFFQSAGGQTALPASVTLSGVTPTPAANWAAIL